MAAHNETTRTSRRGAGHLTTRVSLAIIVFAGVGVPFCSVASAQESNGATGVIVESIPKLYDETADAKTQIAEAVAKAKKENTRVLIQWGGNWCHWCTKLNATMTTDKDIKRTVQYEYEVLHIDAGRETEDEPNGKNMDLVTSYGATIDGYPYLTILDGNGDVVTHQETGSLEAVNDAGENLQKHDTERVNAFLIANKAEPLYAKTVLDEGIARAREENKLVFMHLGAPWCGWCHRLENWMAQTEVKKILDKQFVDIKIDVDRMTGGKELAAERFPMSQDTGIPWFAFVNGDGASVAISTGKDGNVGFPLSVDEVGHFAHMLTENATNLTKDEINVLIDSLEEVGKAYR